MSTPDQRRDLEAIEKAQRNLREAQTALASLTVKPSGQPELDALLGENAAPEAQAHSPSGEGNRVLIVALIALGILASYAVFKPSSPPSEEMAHLREVMLRQKADYELRLSKNQSDLKANEHELSATQAALLSVQKSLVSTEKAYRQLRDADSGDAPAPAEKPAAPASPAPTATVTFKSPSQAAIPVDGQARKAAIELLQVDESVMQNREAREQSRLGFIGVARDLAIDAQSLVVQEAALANARHTLSTAAISPETSALAAEAKEAAAASTATGRSPEPAEGDDYSSLVTKLEIAGHQLSRAQHDILRWQSDQNRAITELGRIRTRLVAVAGELKSAASGK